MLSVVLYFLFQGNNNWIPAILPTSLRHIFQRALVEEKEDLLDKICQVNTLPIHFTVKEMFHFTECPSGTERLRNKNKEGLQNYELDV